MRIGWPLKDAKPPWRLAAAASLWVAGCATFGWGFGIGFLGDPVPWRGAAAFALWGASSLMLGGALKLAGFLRKEK